MKKVFFAAVAVLALASCKKDYTCECKLNSSTQGATTHQLTNMSKKDADEACEVFQVTGISTCTVK